MNAETVLSIYTFLVFHTFPGSGQVVTDAACGFPGGSGKAYLPWDRRMESLVLRFHYLLSKHKRHMTYYHGDPHPTLASLLGEGARRSGIPEGLCKQ